MTLGETAWHGMAWTTVVEFNWLPHCWEFCQWQLAQHTVCVHVGDVALLVAPGSCGGEGAVDCVVHVVTLACRGARANRYTRGVSGARSVTAA